MVSKYLTDQFNYSTQNKTEEAATDCPITINHILLPSNTDKGKEGTRPSSVFTLSPFPRDRLVKQHDQCHDNVQTSLANPSYA